ncbi:MAG: hypothetical protein K9G28_04560, partial [Candidatus Nanopelagicales bacterium]|nr:hypothetical protein [Candidatus Nanopelagicales bacterium]
MQRDDDARGSQILGDVCQGCPQVRAVIDGPAFRLILSDAEFVQQLNAAGYIEPMDASLYPFDDFYPEFQKFPG